MLSAAGVFLIRGRLNVAAEITSLPEAASSEEYWSGLLRFCETRGITEIVADTYGSHAVTVPILTGQVERQLRHEYVIDLCDIRVEKRHRSSIRKAQKNGLTVRRCTDSEGYREHVRLMELSHERRRARGEALAGVSSLETSLAYLECGCGELFQAVADGRVESSALILRSSGGAYYQSAGTTPEGMELGASHFLLDYIARQLKAEGLSIFNLGGAEPGSSLARFKTRFGATIVPLPAMSLYVGPVWRRKLTTVARRVRRDPRALTSRVFGRIRRIKVYAGETSDLMPASGMVSAEFRSLSEDELRNLDAIDDAFRSRQLERLARFGQSYAYGVLIEGKLAHISWLLPPRAVESESPAILQLRHDQAEITACETLPEYRRRGIYGVAIRELFAVARQRGIRRVYMKTAAKNKASQAGILKAGLRSAGVAMLIVPPLLRRTWVLRLFR